MVATLAEPAVLAAAKEVLYPDSDAGHQYAVTETQFTTDTWGDWVIPDDIQSRLAPYNSIQLADGEPDLLGVGMPDAPVLNASAASSPVAVIEAKGSNRNPSAADVGRGIEQAHAHLPEVNLGYVAAPRESITETAQALARDLNIGVISVADTHEARVIEPPRVAGAGDFSTAIDAVRLQATTHHLTEGSFPVNHPKNYLGYALAVAANAETRELYSDYVINSVTGGRRGALLLGLIDERADGETLTHLGAEVVRFARQQQGSIAAALEEFDSWTGSQTRFTKLAPRWAQLARSVAVQYEPTQLIIEALERLQRDGTAPAAISDVAREACRLNQPLAVEVFFTQHRRGDVLTADGTIEEDALQDSSVYKSGIHFQFKYHLYHIGLLTTGGTDTKAQVLTESWQLEHSVT